MRRLKDHSCQFPYCIRSALTVTCPKCGKWFCKQHFAAPPEGGLGHDCEKVDAWQTAGPSLNAVRGLRPEDLKMKDGMPQLHVSLKDAEREAGPKPSRKDWKKVVPK